MAIIGQTLRKPKEKSCQLEEKYPKRDAMSWESMEGGLATRRRQK